MSVICKKSGLLNANSNLYTLSFFLRSFCFWDISFSESVTMWDLRTLIFRKNISIWGCWCRAIFCTNDRLACKWIHSYLYLAIYPNYPYDLFSIQYIDAVRKLHTVRIICCSESLVRMCRFPTMLITKGYWQYENIPGRSGFCHA